MQRSIWQSGGVVRGAIGLGHDLRTPADVDQVDVRALRRELEAHVRGEVNFDRGYRAIYAHDSSNYRQEPLGVVCRATRMT